MEQQRLTAPLRTVIIGSGNVASTIAPALEKAGAIDVVAVYSPTPDHASALACELRHAVAVSDPANVPANAQFYLIAVKDDAVQSVASTLPPNPDAIWAHTSGGVDASALSPLSGRYGVFYPLQTFTKGVTTEMSEVPVFIEANSKADTDLLKAIASKMTPKVYEADSDTRCRMHAAAVFACNFTNHLWAIADDILRRETGTDLSVLHPLLKETLRKALSCRPAEVQTGPAARGDRGIIEKHASLLPQEEADLYRLLSEKILTYHSR